ncbi:MAG: hypothetical protein OEV92_07855, partial [Nitrospinota bacterium]|nr:hypothetical protein [Nitrospinota bacterium]
LVLGFLLAILFIFILEYVSRLKKTTFLDKLAQRTECAVSYGWHGARLDGTFETEPFTISYLPGRRNFLLFPQAPRLTIGSPHETRGKFYAVRKKVETPVAFQSKMFPVVDTGNSLFDKEFSIHSPDQSFIRANFKDGEKRQAMRRIFTLGAEWIHFDGKTMAANWEPFQPSDEIDEDFLRETLARLRAMTKNLQQARTIEKESEGGYLPLVMAILAIFLATVVLAFILVSNV